MVFEQKDYERGMDYENFIVSIMPVIFNLVYVDVLLVCVVIIKTMPD